MILSFESQDTDASQSAESQLISNYVHHDELR